MADPRDHSKYSRKDAPPERVSLASLGKLANPRPAKSAPLDPLPPVHPRAREATLVGSPAPPPSEGPPRSLSPPPRSYPTTAAERDLAAARAEMQDARELLQRLSAAAEEASSRPPPELPWWRTTGGMVKVIGAAFGGLVAATGSIVVIINALRAPTDPQLRADVEATKNEVVGLRKYLAEKDAARAEELEKRFNAMQLKYVELDLRYPAPKADPNRPPKP